MSSSIKEELFLNSLGGIGKWQLMQACLIGASRFMTTFSTFSFMLITPKTEFYCTDLKANSTIKEIENSTCYDECVKYEYDRSVFTSTLITEFNLICDRAWLASFTQTVLMFGVLLGNALIGIVADRYGRRHALLLSIITSVVFSFGSCFATDYWTLTIARFFVGIGSGGIVLLATVIIVECMPNYRLGATCIFSQMTGYASIGVLALFGFYLRNWDTLLIGLSVITSLLLINVFVFDESPRWLLSIGQLDKGVVLMKKIAKRNNRPVDNLEETAKEIIKCMKIERQETNSSSSYLDLFSTKDLTKKTIFMTIVWFIVGLCYFGVNQYATFLGSNIFIVMSISGLLQVTAQFCFYGTNKYFGRKSPTISAFTICSTAMVTLTFLPKMHWASSTLGLIGVFCLSMSFSTIYLISSEIYPTTIRNIGLGFNSIGCRIGAMVAPFFANINPQWIPASIFAGLPMLAVIIILLLPETKDVELIDTLKEKSEKDAQK